MNNADTKIITLVGFLMASITVNIFQFFDLKNSELALEKHTADSQLELSECVAVKDSFKKIVETRTEHKECVAAISVAIAAQRLFNGLESKHKDTHDN